jgi:pectin methylesterase-like acyl-CoA thioesterase
MSKTKLVLIAAAGILLASQISFAASVVVGHCKSGLVSFTTIQAAVNALPTGGTVFVCSGTYPEQVEITGLTASNLIITGVQSGTQFAPVVTSPAGGLAQNAPNFHSGGNPIAAQIWVHNNTALVNINNLTFDAANNLIDCSPSPVGILYQNATGTVTHVATRNQETSPSSNGCQSGYGILVQNSGGGSSLTVNASTVHSFQKNGIVGQTAGAVLIATGNTVLGLGPTTGAARTALRLPLAPPARSPATQFLTLSTRPLLPPPAAFCSSTRAL